MTESPSILRADGRLYPQGGFVRSPFLEVASIWRITRNFLTGALFRPDGKLSTLSISSRSQSSWKSSPYSLTYAILFSSNL